MQYYPIQGFYNSLKKIYSNNLIMKHRILLVVLILAVSFNAPAQTKNTYKFKGTHELSLGLGMYPIDATDITYIMILPITGIYLSERTTSPTINLNYYYGN